MEDKLAQQITSNRSLRDLGTHGFGLPQNVVDTALHNNQDINEAALTVISKWSEKYSDKVEAYSQLCVVLRRIDKGGWINVLKD